MANVHNVFLLIMIRIMFCAWKMWNKSPKYTMITCLIMIMMFFYMNFLSVLWILWDFMVIMRILKISTCPGFNNNDNYDDDNNGWRWWWGGFWWDQLCHNFLLHCKIMQNNRLDNDDCDDDYTYFHDYDYCDFNGDYHYHHGDFHDEFYMIMLFHPSGCHLKMII